MLSCDFTLLPCPNKCKKDEEILKLLRKDIEKHKKEECPRHQYECPYCKEAGEYHERTTTHLKKCPNIKIRCPNDGCRELIQRRMIQQHCHKCSLEILPCKYANIGCKERVLRKDKKDHERDQQHFQLAIDTVHKQEDIIKKQGGMLAVLQSKVALLESTQLATDTHLRATQFKFKVENFNQHKELSDKVCSAAFYTSPGGYKMCINVVPNGSGDGKSTHVSVFAFLMRGENDDHLPWPFTGTVTVELLNQLEDKNHHSKVTSFLQDLLDSQRVTDRKRAPVGYGRPRYIPHSSLGYDEAKHCQYLKDDCLYFRVKVDANTSSKPWLVLLYPDSVC